MLTTQQIEEAKLLAQKVSQSSFSQSNDPATFQKYQDYRSQLASQIQSNSLVSGYGSDIGTRLADVYLGIDSGNTIDPVFFGGTEAIQSKYGGVLGLAKSVVEGTAPVAGRTDVPGGYSITEPGGGFVTPTLSPTDSRPASALSKEEYAARAGVDVSRVQGSPGAYTIGDQQQNNLAIIAGINQEGNADQNAALNAILGEFGKVDTSKSTDLTDKLLSTIEGVFNAPAPKPKTTVDIFNDQKAKLGVDKIEQDINLLDQQIAQLDSDFFGTTQEQENALISTREISRNLSQAEIGYQRKRREILIQKDRLQGQLTTKYNTLNTLMQLEKFDISEATDAYNTRFSQALQIINTVKGLKEFEKNDKERESDNARANAQIVINTMTARGSTWSDLSSSNKLNLQKLGMQSGLGQDFFENMLAVSAGKEILTQIISKDQTQATIVYKDGTTKVIKTGLAPASDSTKGETRDIDVSSYLQSNKGTDGYVSAESYQEALRKFIAGGGTQANFFASFPQETYLRQQEIDKLPQAMKPKQTADVFAETKNTIQQYKNQGFTRKDIEEQYKDADKPIPLEVQKALDELYGK